MLLWREPMFREQSREANASRSIPNSFAPGYFLFQRTKIPLPLRDESSSNIYREYREVEPWWFSTSYMFSPPIEERSISCWEIDDGKTVLFHRWRNGNNFFETVFLLRANSFTHIVYDFIFAECFVERVCRHFLSNDSAANQKDTWKKEMKLPDSSQTNPCDYSLASCDRALFVVK